MQIPATVVGLDFETYYDKDYSLRKPTISTSEYVRDPRFKAHGVSIRTNRQRKAKWYPHELIPQALAQFDWSRCGLLAHHTHFDGLICSHHYGMVPAYYLCTMSMARPVVGHDIGVGLDEVSAYFGGKGKIKGALDDVKGIRDLSPEQSRQLGRYANQDVDEMWRIYWELLPHLPQSEIDLIHLTVNAFANPVVYVDEPRATKALNAELARKNKLFKAAATILDAPGKGAERIEATKKLLGKNDVLAGALIDEGVEPPRKWSVKQGKPIYAFAKADLAFQALEAHENKRVRQLVEARLSVKSTIGEARARRLLDHGKDGIELPLYLHYAKAHTLRWTGGDKLNPQNFQRGSELRRSIKAGPGQKIGVVDSSQIEARTNAWLAGHEALLEAFLQADQGKGKDPYCLLAESVYNKPIDKKKNPTERFVGKVGVLGLGYGMGAEKLQYTLAAGLMGPPIWLPIETCEHIKNVYRRVNYLIVNLWRFHDRMLTMMYNGGQQVFRDILHYFPGGIGLPNGLQLHYPDLQAKYNPRFERLDDFSYRSSKHIRSKIYGGLLTENIVQCLARLIVAEQMLRIAERYRIVTMSHDEVIFLFYWREATKAMKYAYECMRTPPAWCLDIPLNCEGGFDDCYSK